MRKRWLIKCPVTSLRVVSKSSSARVKIIIVEIGSMSGGGGSGSLINLAIKFAGATFADVTGEEEEDDHEGDDTNDREDPGNLACVVEETKTIVSRCSQVFWKKGKSFRAQ